MQFFVPPREHFFRPLTREVVLEVVGRVLAQPNLRVLAFEAGRTVAAEEARAYAGELLRKLKEHGWL